MPGIQNKSSNFAGLRNRRFEMNYIDFVILLIAVVGALYGLIKGILRQLGSLGGFILGIVVSRVFGQSVASLMQQMFDLPAGVSRVIAYSLLFLLVYLVCIQLMRLIHHITHKVALGWLDRLTGALFGAVKYLVVLSILLNLIHIVDPKGTILPATVTASSQCYGYTMRMAPALFSIAQEQLVSETKPTTGLFTLYSVCGEPYFCYINDKAD